MAKIQIMSIDELMDFLRAESEKEGGLEIITPQFNRTDEVVPVTPDGGTIWFDALKKLPYETLVAIGMGVWEDDHYLYPAEWYDFIPDGYPVIDICNKIEPFKKGVTDDDRRYGMLAFGFKVAGPEGI